MKRGVGIVVLAVSSAAALSGGAARAEGHSVAAKAGVLGLGVEYAYTLNDRVAFRLGLNGSELGFDAEESGIDYDFDFVWDSVSVAVDFHPLRGAFRLTGGVLRNDNRLEAVSTVNGDITIGETTYSPDDVGRLTGLVKFDDTAPFLGIGWDWSKKRQRFGVSFDLGVVEQGAPIVTLSATGDLANTPGFAADIAAEEAELTRSLDDFDLLPYATLGLVFRF